MTTSTDTRTQPEGEMGPTGVFHVEHPAAGRASDDVELARYSVTGSGERILARQRVDGHVRVVDRPSGRGRAYLVEGELELDGPDAVDAIVSDYLREARKSDAIPMRTSVVRRLLDGISA
jgi:hypothetical protein